MYNIYYILYISHPHRSAQRCPAAIEADIPCCAFFRIRSPPLATRVCPRAQGTHAAASGCPESLRSARLPPPGLRRGARDEIAAGLRTAPPFRARDVRGTGAAVPARAAALAARAPPSIPRRCFPSGACGSDIQISPPSTLPSTPGFKTSAIVIPLLVDFSANTRQICGANRKTSAAIQGFTPKNGILTGTSLPPGQFVAAVS